MNIPTFKLLDGAAILPKKATAGSAGYDLSAVQNVTVVGGQGTYLIKTGVAMQIPLGYYGRIAMRSGLALREHLNCSAGVIDADYYPREIGVLVYCTKINHTVTINSGERFAQIICEKIADDAMLSAPSIEHAGFGSTGLN